MPVQVITQKRLGPKPTWVWVLYDPEYLVVEWDGVIFKNWEKMLKWGRMVLGLGAVGVGCCWGGVLFDPDQIFLGWDGVGHGDVGVGRFDQIFFGNDGVISKNWVKMLEWGRIRWVCCGWVHLWVGLYSGGV
jgi:hypothetical protein